MIKKAALATIVLFVLLLLPLPGAPALAVDFEEGQIWRYHTRPGEEASRLVIARIDRDLATEPVYHLYIDGLRLKNPLYQGGVQDHLPHAPVTRQTLEASVTELEQSGAALPDISEGYTVWLLAFEKGQAGVFTLPVDQILQHIEKAFNRPR